jgi:hypothetical protein
MINPLYKIDKNQYFVFNYNYLTNKLFTGFSYDLFATLKGEKNRINNIKIKTTNDFRSYIAEYFTEKYLFKKLIEVIFKQTYYKVIFDDEKTDSFPDAVVLYKNNMLIFEIKDASIHHDIFKSRNYQDIKETLENKYGNTSKGTGQITKFLSKMYDNKYVNYFNKHNIEIDLKKLNIYPVIIYTESAFDCSGFMNFLNKTFIQQMNEEFNQIPFRFISRLNFINLDFIIDYADILSNNNTNFLKVLKEIGKEALKRENKLNKNIREGDLEKYNENFESHFHYLFKSDHKKNYINFLNDEFDIVSIFKDIIINTKIEEKSSI